MHTWHGMSLRDLLSTGLVAWDFLAFVPLGLCHNNKTTSRVEVCSNYLLKLRACPSKGDKIWLSRRLPGEAFDASNVQDMSTYLVDKLLGETLDPDPWSLFGSFGGFRRVCFDLWRAGGFWCLSLSGTSRHI